MTERTKEMSVEKRLNVFWEGGKWMAQIITNLVEQNSLQREICQKSMMTPQKASEIGVLDIVECEDEVQG